MKARFTRLALGAALGSFFSGAVLANNGDREAHKNTIRNALQNDAPDVITWYPGNRMGPLVDAGLFMDISDMWASDPNLSQHFEAIKPTMSRDGKQWGVPYSYYQWGVYYSKDIYEKPGLSEPATWAELLGNCDRLTEVGVTPFTVGSQNLWPLAGIFDSAHTPRWIGKQASHLSPMAMRPTTSWVTSQLVNIKMLALRTTRSISFSFLKSHPECHVLKKPLRTPFLSRQTQAMLRTPRSSWHS